MLTDLKEEIKKLDKAVSSLKENIETDEGKLKELREKISQPDFWQNQEEASKIQQQFSQLKENIDTLKNFERELEDLKKLIDLVEEDSKEEEKLWSDLKELKDKIEEKSREVYLSGKYDANSAILTIQSGAGGRDSEDWTSLLLRMYQRFAERRNFKTKIIHQKFGEGGGPEGRIGIKEVSLEIKGKFSFGLLRGENGIHRLVRISPFSSKGLRHTSFAKVEVLPEIGRKTASEVKIRPEDLKIETFRASGPGGQYVNRRESAVRIIHLPTGIKAESQSERSQGANRKIAKNVLVSKLVAKKEKEKKEKMNKIKGKNVSAEFGNQIRSYVFHPYQMVKDHRTNVQSSNIDSVLDGDLDNFIKEEIKL